MNDIRYALRQLARTPGFTIIAVLTLALCIGANSAIFSVLDTILLKPYPWPGSERLVYANNAYPLLRDPVGGVSIPDYVDRRRDVKDFEDTAIYTRVSLNLAGESEPERVNAMSVSPSLFSTLASPAAFGRTFSEDDAKPGAPATVVLSNGFWKDRFASDPAVIGRAIRLNNRPVTVIGVMGPDFYFPDPDTQAYTPFAFTPAQLLDDERGNEFSNMIARVRPGVSMGTVQAELDMIQARNVQRLPDQAEYWKESGFHGKAVGFLDKNVKDIRSMLWLVQAAVAAALLIGCANVAGLLLARAVGREKELAIRTALGASRGQLLRLLLIEALVLFVAGGLLGLVVAVWGLDALRLIGLSKLPRGFAVGVDPTIFVFTMGCAVVSGLVFGSIPAWSTARDTASASLKEAGARGSAGRRTQRLRAALVVSEIAIAVMLASTTCLLIKSFVRMQAVDPGFIPGGVITGMVQLPEGRYDKPEKIEAFRAAVIDRLSATPGVESAGTIDCLPFGRHFHSSSYSSPDIKLPAGTPSSNATDFVVDTGYLRSFGLTLLQGRWFNDADTAKGRRVVIIDRVMLDRYWKGEDPIGKRIIRGSDNDHPWYVVGVVAAVKSRTLDEDTNLENLYFPFAQDPQPGIAFVVRTSGDPQRLSSAVREAVHAADPGQPVYDITPMDALLSKAAQTRRAPVILLAVFGGLSMVLAMMGVYGVLAFSVAQRTTEFGVRMALGATARDIAGLVLRMGGVLIAIGIALGLAGYLAMNQLVASLLFNTTSTDPVMLVAAPLLLALVALAACLLPTLRATRINPVVALRGD
jgi:putative ABC transport system permease protein